MRISELLQNIDAVVHVEGRLEHVVTRAEVGDLLSFVMGEASEGSLWVTVQTHLNVAAVAVLKEIPLIIVAGARVPDPALISRCEIEGISLISVKESIFAICKKLVECGIVG